jgi:hypothetical protein
LLTNNGNESTLEVTEILPKAWTWPEFVEKCETDYQEFKRKLTIDTVKGPDTQQWNAALRLAFAYGETRQNMQVIAPTGQGKTYVLAVTLRLLADFWPDRFDPLRCMQAGKMPPIIIQPPKSICQCRRVLASFGVHHAIVTSLASLRATLGTHLLEFKTVIVNQQPVIYPFWFVEKAPAIIAADEIQQAKNESTQTDILVSAAAHGIPVLCLSATPYSKPAQAKAVALIIGPNISGHNGRPVILTGKLWPSFVQECCPPNTSPVEWTPAGLRKVQQYLEPYTVRWSIPYKHKSITKLCACTFLNAASRQRYDDADEAWQEVRAKLGKGELTGVIRMLVALQKFLQVAEEERVDPLMQMGVDRWLEARKRGKPVSIIFAFANRTSADKAIARLRAILGEAEFKKHVALIVGGINSDTDHALFQADKKTILVMTIACGGAALSLDNNPFNKNPREMWTSCVWNDIQVVQLVGRGLRLLTQSTFRIFFLYFKGTQEVRRMNKVLRKIRTLKEITTKIYSHAATTGAGTFIEDVESLDHVDMGRLQDVPPQSEDDEEMAANQIIGTQSELEIESEEETEE